MHRSSFVIAFCVMFGVLVPVPPTPYHVAGAATLQEQPAAEPYPIKTGRADQWHGVATSKYVGWTQFNPDKADWYNVWVKPEDGRRVRANWSKANGYMGDIDRNRVIYEQHNGEKTNVKLFNVKKKRRFNPAGVNSKHVEYAPSLWNNRVLFGRGKEERTGFSYVLFWTNINNGRKVRLGRQTSPEFLLPGQISGDWASWTRCDDATEVCFALHHNIKTGERTRVASSAPQTYFPAVEEDGTLFFVRSGNACGEAVEIIRRGADGLDEVIAQMPPEVDVGTLKAKPRPDGGTTLAFTRLRCSDLAADIYGIDIPPEATEPGSSERAGAQSATSRHPSGEAGSRSKFGVIIAPPRVPSGEPTAPY